MPTSQPRRRAGWLAGFAAASGMALILGASTALAAEAEGGHGAGLPQLDPSTFPPQLIWLAISFAALYFLMARVALPKLGAIVEQRQERISSDLEKAQSLRDEAGSVIGAYEKAIADARSEAQSVMASTSTEISQAQTVRQSAFAAELTARVKAAEERIAVARDQAVANVRSVAVEVAQAAAERLAGLKVDAAEAEAAVGASMRSA